MKVLLRSLFNAGTSDDNDGLYKNVLTFTEANIGFDIKEDGELWEFIRGFAEAHHHVPTLQTIRSYFDNTRKTEVVDRLEIICNLTPIYQGDFIRRLEERSQDRKRRILLEVLADAGRIVQTGLEVQQGKEKRIFRGPVDAVRYISEHSNEIIVPTLGSRMGGNALGDTEGFVRDYNRVKMDPDGGLGQFSGIKQWDDVFRGARKKQMWTHAAFTGHMKSTIALNWVYNQAVYMGYSSCFFSLEMPFEQLRNILCAMHSMHGKFRDVRMKLGIQKTDVDVGLEYSRIRDALLSPEEENFLLEWVVADLNESTADGTYGKILIETYDPDSGELKVSDISARCHILYDRNPFNLLVVDHALLVSPKKWVPSQTDRGNEVVRDLKKLSMTFGRGMGMAVLNLFQINREGYKQALKNAGKYTLTALSYANEVERSSDIVTTSWFDEDERKQNRALIQNLKSRDDRHCDDFYIRAEMTSRRVLTSFDVPMIEAQKRAMGDRLDSGETLESLLS